MKEISTSSAEDKEEAKKIFFEYSCNHVEMARNDIYFSKYHISKEQEAQWRNEFLTYWRSQLSTEDLTAVQKLEEVHAVESIPDLIAMVDKGDSYANLRIAQALLSLADWLGRDETLRTQTRATALKTVQSILDRPMQVSDRHKSDIERLGDFDPENYVITFAKLAKGEYATLKLKGSTIGIENRNETLMSFFKKMFGKGEPKGEPLIVTPTQNIPGLEPIIVQAIENLYPDVEDQKQVFQWALDYKKEMKRNDTKGLLAMLAYSEGNIRKLPGPDIWLDGHFRGEMTDPIFPKMRHAEEWVKSITKTRI